jgi:hypothetical protein
MSIPGLKNSNTFSYAVNNRLSALPISKGLFFKYLVKGKSLGRSNIV